jgi:anti-sigma B factor antagonist
MTSAQRLWRLTAAGVEYNFSRRNGPNQRVKSASNRESGEMPLRISVRQLSDVSVVDLDGRLIIGPESEALAEKLRGMSRQGVRKLLVNLEKVTQLDSSGICSLLQGYTSMKQAGGAFKLLHPGGHTREVLEVMRLTETIPTLDDEAQAVASFASTKPVVS